MRFDMGSTTLSTLTQQTGGASEDLGALIQELIRAADPLEGTFNGEAKAAFDGFKLRADEITTQLNTALAAILGGIQGMDTSFIEGEQTMVDNSRGTEGAANFDGARFGAA